MAQGNPTVLKIRTEIENLQGLNQLKTAVRRISAEAKGANNDFGRLTGRIKELQGATVKSVNNLEAQKQAFEALRRSVDVTSREFKSATDEIKKLDQQLAKVEGRKAGGGRLRAGAQVAGTIAGAGVFGGPEGAIGAAVGGIFGGVPGAIAGGAIGAQVGGIRQAAGATAEYSANLQKLRIALQGVTTSQNEYSAALDIIQRATKDFAIPQDLVTKQFTRLQASVQGAGGNINDTETAFKGIVAAVRATGGSLADVDAALTATAQVFSKGKVSAEELRQQIGERLPGAFTLFAESIGMTPQELDKALEDGKVSLQDFQTFAEAIFQRYGETAKIIADGPESAGDRLKVALGKLSESIGTLLAPIGAAFQETFISAAQAVTTLINKLNELFGLGRQGLESQLARIEKKLAALPGADVSPQAAGRQGIVDTTAARAALELQKREVLRQLADLSGPDIVQPQQGRGLPGITPTTGGGSGGGAGRGARSLIAAQNAAIELGRRLKRLIRDASADFAGLGVSAEDAIDNKYRKALFNAEDKQNDLLRKIEEYESVTGETYSNLRAQVSDYAIALEQVAAKQRDLALQELSDKRFSEMLKGYGFSGDVDVSGKMFGAMTPQEFPTGVDSILQPNQLKQNIQELRTSLQELVDPVNQVTSAAATIGNAFSQSFVDAISGSKTAKEALADFFSSVGSYFLDMAKQIIAQMIQIAILNAVTGLLPGLGGGGLSGGLGGLSGTSNVPFIGSMPFTGFADGGTVMPGNTYMVGERGPELLQLNRNGSGQVINNNQLSSAMNRYRRSGGGTTTAAESGMAASGATESAVATLDKPIDVRYSVERINNVDYVTADQFQAGMKQAAQQGEQRALAKLRNSPGARRRVGL